MKASTTRGKILKNTVNILISAVFWTALWDFAAHIVDMKYVFPSPAATFGRLFELMSTERFYIHAGNSLLSIIKGFLGGALIGTALGILSALIKGVDILFSPLHTVIRATPVASFIILAFIWMDNKDIPVLISVLMITPIVWSTLKTAIANVDPQLKEMASCYKMPLKRCVIDLYLPSVLPTYLTSLVTAMGLGWKAGIAAEVLCGSVNTLGNDLSEAKRYLEVKDQFALTVAIIILSVIMELCFRAMIKKITSREVKHGYKNQ